MDNKKKVFISHIGSESKIATEFKALIEKSFLGLIDVFVSSDGTSIKMGKRWLDEVLLALEGASVEIVVCSKISVLRPWINFEAGAGWIRGIPVIPICHSGAEPSKLPTPLNLLQGTLVTDEVGLERVFDSIADVLGAARPEVDFGNFISAAKEFEKKYTFWDACNKAFYVLDEVNSEILQGLRTDQEVDIYLSESNIQKIEEHAGFLFQAQILEFARKRGVRIDGETGMQSRVVLRRLCEFYRIFEDPNRLR